MKKAKLFGISATAAIVLMVYVGIGVLVALVSLFGSYVRFHDTSYLSAPFLQLAMNFLLTVIAWPVVLVLQLVGFT